MGIFTNINKHHKAYVCIEVFENKKPVLLVSRADGDWCFLCGGEHADDASSYRVVGIGHVLERDPTLELIEDLPLDWEAERLYVNAPWDKRPII
jgi:hypothetical protein